MTAADQSKRTNPRGIAIGNGLTAATIQYAHYIDMANSSYGILLATDPQRLAGAWATVTECVHRIRDCLIAGGVECIKALNTCYTDMESAFDVTNRNPYDIRQVCDQANAVDCYNSMHITGYLNDAAIEMYFFQIPQDKAPTWVECSDQISESFTTRGDYLVDH